MSNRLPTRAELASLEHDEREAVILSAVDQRIADLARLRTSAASRGGRSNANSAMIALRTSIRRLIDRAAEFDIRVQVQRAL